MTTAAAAALAAGMGNYAAGAQNKPGPGIEKGPYAILTSLETAGKWGKVTEALVAKHKDRANLFTYKKDPSEAQEQLAKLGPREIAYVCQMAEAKPENLKKVSAVARSLEKDPYFDAILGVITGLDEKDALKLVECNGIEPKVALLKAERKLREFLSYFEDGWYYSLWHGGRKDGQGGSHAVMKDGRKTSEMKGYQHTVFVLYSQLKNHDVDVFVTGGNADYNIWECAIKDTKDGAFLASKGSLTAIDEKALAAFKAKRKYQKIGDQREFTDMDRPKIWYAAGNSMIGQIKNEDSMVLAAIRSMGVRQMWAAIRGATAEEQRLGIGLQHYWGPGALDFPEAALASQQNFVYSMEGQKTKAEPDAFVLYGDPSMPSKIRRHRIITPPYVMLVKESKSGDTATLDMKYTVVTDWLIAANPEFLTKPVYVHSDKLGDKKVRETSDADVAIWGNRTFTGLDFSKKGKLAKGYEARIVIEGKLQR